MKNLHCLPYLHALDSLCRNLHPNFSNGYVFPEKNKLACFFPELKKWQYFVSFLGVCILFCLSSLHRDKNVFSTFVKFMIESHHYYVCVFQDLICFKIFTTYMTLHINFFVSFCLHIYQLHYSPLKLFLKTYQLFVKYLFLFFNFMFFLNF